MYLEVPYADWHKKLDQTYIRYKGKPVYIRIMEDEICIYSLPNQKLMKRVNEITPDFDFESMPLGYFTKDNKCYYLTRVPYRKIKQGISIGSVLIHPLPNIVDRALPRISNVLNSQEFVDMVLGNYPPLYEALTSLRESHEAYPRQNSEIAISISIAMRIDENGIIHIYYKNDLVGWIQPNKFIVHVPSNMRGSIVSKHLSHVLGWEID